MKFTGDRGPQAAVCAGVWTGQVVSESILWASDAQPKSAAIADVSTEVSWIHLVEWPEGFSGADGQAAGKAMIAVEAVVSCRPGC